MLHRTIITVTSDNMMRKEYLGTEFLGGRTRHPPDGHCTAIQQVKVSVIRPMIQFVSDRRCLAGVEQISLCGQTPG